MRKVTSEVGNIFGRLMVLGYAESSRYKAVTHANVFCRCECGTEKVVRLTHLTQGRTLSCGCHSREMATTHGMFGTTTYNRWGDMKARCATTAKAAKYYAERGITVCKEWETFEQFYADMGDCPDGLELDRIDNSKGYSKENCRWASRSQQMRNTSKRVGCISEYRGVSYHKQRNKWRAFIRVAGRTLHLGLFATEIEAAKAYNDVASKIDGQQINII